MQRVGIYPGTFDMMHNGHLSFALESLKLCKLDKIIFLPEERPRAKTNVTPVIDRYDYMKSMITPYPDLSVALLQSQQFTIFPTLQEIQTQFKNTELTLLVGSDVALGLHKWDNIQKLLGACDIAIGIRSHEAQSNIHDQIHTLNNMSPSTTFTIVETIHASLTSSMFRNKIKKLG